MKTKRTRTRIIIGLFLLFLANLCFGQNTRIQEKDESDLLVEKPHWGIGISAIGSPYLDLDYKRFRAYAGFALSALASSFRGYHDLLGSLGAGPSIPLKKKPRWRMDWSLYASLYDWHESKHDDDNNPDINDGWAWMVGLAWGMHYTSPKGFTFLFTIPIVNFGLGSWESGDKTSFSSMKWYVIHSAVTYWSFPFLSIGHRF